MLTSINFEAHSKSIILCCFIGYYSFTSIHSFNVKKGEIKFCQVYNIELLTCYWDVIFVDNQKVVFDLYYKTGWNFQDVSEIPFSQLSKCERSDFTDNNSTLEWCTLHYEKHSIVHIPYTFILRSSNPLLAHHSEPLYIEDLYSIYKSGVVKELWVTNVTSTTARIQWAPPNSMPHFYNLLLHDSRGTQIDTNTSETRFEFLSLFAYRSYKLSIRCIYRPSSAEGQWSAWTHRSFETLEDVPGAAPKILKNAFRRIQSNLYNVVWKFTEGARNGKVLKTRIRTYNTCDSSVLRPFNSSVEYTTTKEIDGEMGEAVAVVDEVCGGLVFVDMATSIGYNSSLQLSPLTIPPKRLVPEGIDLREVNATVRNEGDFLIEWRNIRSCHSYSLIYWLHDGHKNSNYSSVSPASPPQHLRLPPIAMKSWKFGISTQYLSDDEKFISSEMAVVDCVYNITKEIFLEQLSLQHTVSACSVDLQWPPLNCTTTYPPYLSYYTLSYFPTHRSEALKEVQVSRGQTKVTLGSLECGTSYNTSLSAATLTHTILLHSIQIRLSSNITLWIWTVAIVFLVVVSLAVACVVWSWVRDSRKTIVVQNIPLNFVNESELPQDDG